MKNVVSIYGMFLTAALFALSGRIVMAQAHTGSSATGKDLFGQKCALCHGTMGEPTPMGTQVGAKDLRSDEILKMSDDDLIKVITKGKGNMPPFSSQLSQPDVDNLIAFIRTLKK